MKLLNTLFVLFLGLKLANFINWSWFLVFLPIAFSVMLFVFKIALKEAAKLKMPWAVKFIKWVYS